MSAIRKADVSLPCNTKKMFSKACEYGIKAAVFIAVRSQQQGWVGLNEIAEAINSPVSFTAKVLQKLTRNTIVVSVKGPNGGFGITPEKTKAIMLSQIVSAIDGDAIYNGCGLGFEHCDESKPCPVHFKFKKIRNDLKKMLENTSLYDLSQDVNQAITFLKG